MGIKEPEPGTTPRLHMRFVIADVDLPIIGVDLLSHYGLLVDCRNTRLLDGVTSLSTPGLIAPPHPLYST